jgi:hypothetical protein
MAVLTGLLVGLEHRRPGRRPGRRAAALHRHDTARHRARRDRRYPACAGGGGL